MDAQDTVTILSLRLLIARAANRDSLAWWEDDSLSSHADYILQRTFPVEPHLAARRLALVATAVRHQALLSNDSSVLHLFRLDRDNRDRLATRFHTLHSIQLPDAPIDSTNTLRNHLLQLTKHPMPYTIERRGPHHALQIGVPRVPPDANLLVHRAQTLAWAYLENQSGPVNLPYCIDDSS
jgi:hypothetical protein